MRYERDINIGFPALPAWEERRNVVTTKFTSADAVSGTANLFKVVGAVKVLSLFGKFIDVTDVSNITAAYIDLYDNSAHVITKATGTTLTSAVVGSILGRNAISTTAMYFGNASDGIVIDSGLNELTGFVSIAQTGTDTYIRFNFTSDGGGYAFTIGWEVIWMPLVEGGYITSA